MAYIIPFRGTLYNPEKIKDLSKVVAPPYDVISPEEQGMLYDSEPHNIIRILLGKDFRTDDEEENKYTRAVSFLKDWQKKGILKKDKTESIYVYLQEFTIDGRLKQRLGFIALLKLEDFGLDTTSVYPHENTLEAPKEDRIRLLTSIEANLGPIFALFADEDRSIDNVLIDAIRSEPIIDISDYQGIRNKLWRVSDRMVIERIVSQMKDKKLFIADGHHRYEVGLMFSKIKRDDRFGYTLTYFTDLYADGIVILPVYRLIRGISKDMLLNLEKELAGYFAIEGISSKEHIKDFLSTAGPSERRFVIYKQRKFTGLMRKDNDSLDVNVLHDYIIKPIQQKVESGEERISIDFTKDLDYAISEVDSQRFSLSVFLNAAKISEIKNIAFSGKRMPQKTTYFYPKVLTGLVMNVF